MSEYQAFKLWLATYVPVDRDILHVAIGFGLFVIAVIFDRRGLRLAPFLMALVVALFLGIGMELADRRDDLFSLGFWRWRASLLDVLRTVLFPLVGFVIVSILARVRRL